MSYPEKKLLRALFESRPIVPKHRVAESIESGAQVTAMISERDRRFFTDFDLFAEIANHHPLLTRESPWRVQDTGQTELHDTASDSPRYGRRYDAFYNQVRLGRIEVGAWIPYTAEKPLVSLHVNLTHVRILPFRDVRGWLIEICWLTQGGGEDYVRKEREVEHALIEHLWDTPPWGVNAQWCLLKAPDLPWEPPAFTLSLLGGSAGVYLEWRKKAIEKGLDAA